MSVDQKHPDYVEFAPDWETMRDTYRGERIVKEKSILYLSPTSGMEQDGMQNANQPGFKAYMAYKKRAHFPDIVREAIEAAIGVMHQKPPVIELPAEMEPLLERATLRHESLEVLLRRINTEQLTSGRLGLLIDFPSATRATDSDTEEVKTQAPAGPPPLPYIAVYNAEKIINWDYGYRDGLGVETLNLVVLDESQQERQSDFQWKDEAKYRVLVLGATDVNEEAGAYRVGVFRGDNLEFNEESMMEPMYLGQTIDFIPFTIINSKDVVPDPDDPPLLGLANLVLSIYRQDADYKQSLFMQGQDTLVTIGATETEGNIRVGANAHISIPGGAGHDAKFIGVESKGIEEQRLSLEADRQRASSKGGQLLDTVSRERESGSALTVRVAARTASLKQVALAGAFGLQQCLKQIAEWIGANPDEVSVLPNLDFVSETFDPDKLLKLVQAKNQGAPLSWESIHAIMQEKDFTSFDFEEELSKIEEEVDLVIGSNNPDDLVDENGDPLDQKPNPDDPPQE